jgi:hypothetical protein
MSGLRLSTIRCTSCDNEFDWEERSRIGHVYFIGADAPDKPIKIGFTQAGPQQRLASLQTSSPYRLEIIATIKGTFEIERRLHELFAGSRLTGKWFRRTPELMAVISAFSISR